MIWSEFIQFIDNNTEVLFRVRLRKALKKLKIKELIDIPIFISYQTRLSDYYDCDLLIFEGREVDRMLLIPGYLNLVSYESHDSEFINDKLGLYYVVSKSNYKLNPINCMIAVILVFNLVEIQNIDCELLVTNLYEFENDVFKKYTAYRVIDKVVQRSITTSTKEAYEILVFKSNNRYFVDMYEPNLSVLTEIIKDVYIDRFRLGFTESLEINCKNKTKYLDLPLTTKKLTLLNADRLGSSYNEVEEVIIKPAKEPRLYNLMKLFPKLKKADIPLASQYDLDITLTDSYSENNEKINELIELRNMLDRKIKEMKL